MATERAKKTHVVAVNAENVACQSSSCLQNASDESSVSAADKFNTGLLDYMNVECLRSPKFTL